jgi:predicted metal-dependent hydrolase
MAFLLSVLFSWFAFGCPILERVGVDQYQRRSMVRGLYDIPLEEERDCYERGIAYFNAIDFFEAHEIWEDAWNGTSGRRRRFYQGLIQMAVTLVHLQRGNRLGVEKVFERALGRWADLPVVYMGLNLREFEERMRDLLADVLAAPAGSAVKFDPSRFFTVRLEYDPFSEPREEADD